jgi:hypothetical protein
MRSDSNNCIYLNRFTVIVAARLRIDLSAKLGGFGKCQLK